MSCPLLSVGSLRRTQVSKHWAILQPAVRVFCHEHGLDNIVWSLPRIQWENFCGLEATPEIFRPLEEIITVAANEETEEMAYSLVWLFFHHVSLHGCRHAVFIRSDEIHETFLMTFPLTLFRAIFITQKQTRFYPHVYMAAYSPSSFAFTRLLPLVWWKTLIIIIILLTLSIWVIYWRLFFFIPHKNRLIFHTYTWDIMSKVGKIMILQSVVSDLWKVYVCRTQRKNERQHTVCWSNKRSHRLPYTSWHIDELRA